MKPGYTGFKRLIYATRFSWQGLRAAWRQESAVRQELAVIAVGLVCTAILPVTAVEATLLVGSLLLVLIVELLNTAVESVVDRISDDIHPLSGQAKDLGSAAVLISTVVAAFTWIMLALPKIL
jgi:diacylglycerol kinase (ATP)